MLKTQKRHGTINQIFNNKKLGCDNIYLSENEVIITDSKQVSNKFNNYFVTVAENLTERNGQTNSKYQEYLKTTSENSLMKFKRKWEI